MYMTLKRDNFNEDFSRNLIEANSQWSISGKNFASLWRLFRYLWHVAAGEDALNINICDNGARRIVVKNR
jgi:hypothetical protein